MPDKKPTIDQKTADATASAASGFFERIWDRVEDAAEPFFKVYDPVKKVCYDHMANHYERKYRTKFPRHHSKVFWFDMFLLAMLGTLVVVWFFVDAFLPLIPPPQLAHLESTGPQTIVSGADTEYVYAYRNVSASRTLGCATLRVHLPPGTFIDEHVADPDKNDEKICTVGVGTYVRASEDTVLFSLGNVPPASGDEVTFRARTFGATGDTATMTAELLYWDEAATVASRVSSRNERAITGSVLSLRLQTPSVISRGITQDIAVSYANASQKDLRNVSLLVSVPDDFVVTGALPSLGSNREWRLGTLPVGESGTLHIYGYFRAVPERLRTASIFTLRGYVDGADNGGHVLAEKIRQNTDPRAADLSFSAELQEPAGAATLVPGQHVRYAVRFTNNGTSVLKHLAVTVDADKAFLQDVTPATLQWDEKTSPTLHELKPGESGEVFAEFTVKSAITEADLKGATFPALHLTADGTYFLDEDDSRAVRVETATTDLPIATNLGVEAAALYFTKDGDQLGVGPLPPKVGETTKYRVFVTVSTTTTAADGVVVEATLPRNVTWTGKTSVTNGSALDYFPSTRRIRWNVGTVPAAANGDSSRIGASFEVALTPTAADVGTTPVLCDAVRVSGVDSATGTALHTTGEQLTTDLPYDRRSAGKGTVLPATDSPQNEPKK